MSKYIDADKLIAEIERMREINKKAFMAEHIRADVLHGRAQAINHLFDFITFLKQEQPVDIPSAGSGSMGTTPPKFKLEVKEQSMEGLEEEMDEMWLEYCEDVDYLVYASIARHFAEWGMNQCPLPEDTTIFLKGVAEGKRLMMEEAVEGRYMKAAGRVYVESWPLDIAPDLVKSGDEVKIIIVKEDDKNINSNS